MVPYISPIENQRSRTDMLCQKISEMINAMNTLGTQVNALQEIVTPKFLFEIDSIKEKVEILTNNPGIKALLNCSKDDNT